MDKASFDLTCKSVIDLAKETGQARAVVMEITPTTFFLIGAVPFPGTVEWGSDAFTQHEKQVISVFGDVMLEVLHSRNAFDSSGTRVSRTQGLHGLFFLAQFQHNAQEYAEKLIQCFELRMNPQRSHGPPPSPRPAVSVVRRDQHNDELRAFYRSLTTMTDGMLCECSGCGILLPRDGGGMAGGVGIIKALQERPKAVAAFLLLMGRLLGPERVPSMEGNPMLVGLGLLSGFAPKNVGPNEQLCPVCAGSAAPAAPPVSPPQVPASAPAVPLVRGKGRREQPPSPFDVKPQAVWGIGLKDVYCCTFSASGQYLAVAATAAVRVVSVAHRKVVRSFDAPGSVNAMAFSPDVGVLLVGGYRYQLSAWDTKNAALRWKHQREERTLGQVYPRYHPKAAEVVCQMEDGVYRFASADGTQLAKLQKGVEGHPGYAFAVDPGGQWAATTAQQGAQTLIGFPRLLDGQPVFPPIIVDGIVKSLAISADGKWLACTGTTESGIKGNGNKAWRAALHVWSLAERKWLPELPFAEPGNGCVSVAFVPGSAQVVGGWDREVALWSLTDAQLQQSFPLGSPFLSVAVTKDHQLVAVTTDGEVSVWNVRTK